MPACCRWSLLVVCLSSPIHAARAQTPEPAAGPAASTTTATDPPAAAQPAQGEEELMAMEDFLRIDSVSLGSFDGSKITATPASVSYITEDMWRSWGPRRMWDAMRFLPGVFVMPDFYPNVTIRGFLNRNVAHEVSINIDGTNTAASMVYYLNINPSALSRIEVMRGPGGTIYGSDAFAGAVGFDTWSAKENRLEVQAGGGAYNYYDAAVRGHYRFTDKLSGTLILSVAGQRDVDVPYNFADTFSGQNAHSSFAETYNTQNLILKVHYDKLFSVGAYLTNQNRAGWYAVSGPGVPAGRQNDLSSYSGLFTATAHQGIGPGLNLDESAFIMSGRLANQTGIAGGVVRKGDPTGDQTLVDLMWGASVRLSQHVEAIPVEWNLVYQLRDFRESENLITAPGFTMPSNPAVGPSAINHGAILSGAAHLFEQMLTIDGGVRYDYFSFGSLSSVSGHAMLAYEPTEGTAIKAIYARGFRAPVAAEVYGTPPFIIGNDKLLPETMDNFELVLLTKHETWQAELTGFYGQTKDQINSYPYAFLPGLTEFQNINRGSLDGWGIEAAGDLSLRPVAVRAAVTYNYSRQRAGGGLSAEEILGFPTWMIDLGVQYDVSVAELTLAANARAMFRRGAGLGLPGFLNNYFNGDLSATWRFGRLFHIPGGDFEAVAVLNNFTNSINAQASLETYPWSHEPGIHAQGLVRWLW